MSAPAGATTTEVQGSLVTTALLVVAIIFPILASISVAVRIYARTFKQSKLKADDWTIILALV
jgi:hypothetical protein